MSLSESSKTWFSKVCAETADIYLGKDNVGPHGVGGCSHICETVRVGCIWS